jgi:hypothetical protein
LTEIRRTFEGSRRESHHRDGPDEHETDTKPQVDAFIADEARRDALIAS